MATVPFLAAQRGERIGIVGPNGAGKTTLLRTVAGELPPLDGSLTFGHTSSSSATSPSCAGRPSRGPPCSTRCSRPSRSRRARPAAYLARFLFRGDDVQKEVRSLSGGERSRLELALLGIQPSNLLLLDEPTNHLDIPAREAIESFMVGSPATLLVVSHDRRLLETVCEKLWVVDDGAAAPFDGGYRAWRAAVAGGWTVASALEEEAKRLRGGGAARRSTAAEAWSAPNSTSSAKASAKGASAAGAAVAAKPRPRKTEKLSKDAYRKQKTALDAELSRLGLRKSHLELAMGDPKVTANFVEMRRVTSELADVDAALAAAEDAWLELEERAP